MDEPSTPSSEPERELVNPVPFVVALVGFVVVATLAIVFLRTDADERVVHPDQLRAVGDGTIEAVATEEPACAELLRAQVDLADEQIFVELVIRDADAVCPERSGGLRAEVTLPEPIGDRRLLAGPGRLQLPCAPAASGFSCGADR